MNQADRENYNADLETYAGWRTSLLPNVLRSSADKMENLFLFGVFGGKSVVEWSRILKQINAVPKKVICFDSFEGIPIEKAEKVLRPEWDPNQSDFFSAFNALKFFETSSVDEAVTIFRDKVRPFLPKQTELIVVPGFFNESLTSELASNMPKASFVDIDVDIYSSTFEALDWLAKHSLIGSETVISYDDWGGTPGHKKMLDGESRAHREVSENYGLYWDKLVATSDDQQVVFKLR